MVRSAARTTKPKAVPEERLNDARKVYAYWSSRTATKPAAKGVIEKIKRRLLARLSEGFTVEDLKACVDVSLIDPFYVEKGYAKNPEVLWRNAERVLALVNKAEGVPGARPADDDRAQRFKRMTEQLRKEGVRGDASRKKQG